MLGASRIWNCFIALAVVSPLGLISPASGQEADQTENVPFAIVSDESNDLVRLVKHHANLYSDLESALQDVPDNSALLILANAYPGQLTPIDQKHWDAIARKRLNAFVEYPAWIPGLEVGSEQSVRWERGVTLVDVPAFPLPSHTLLSLQDCKFRALQLDENRREGGAFPKTWLAIGRVAGHNRAVFGPPANAQPILVQISKQSWITTTKLSDFLSARYAPHQSWVQLWEGILQRMRPSKEPYISQVQPLVRPYYLQSENLPSDANSESIKRAAQWYLNSQLLISSERESKIHEALLANQEVIGIPDEGTAVGDGSLGILEGYASQILPDGTQLQRTPIRADCQAEAAAALAINGIVNRDEKSIEVAKNLLDYLYFKSDMQQNERGDPKHPAYGLIAWGTVSAAWYKGNYGDDNARTILATIIAASMLSEDRWNDSMLRALYGNLRTTGKLGFRGDRVDIEQLEAEGIETISQKSTINLSPFFEAYLWACYLWAYHQTGDVQFRETAVKGIERVMESYPQDWRWGDNLDRTRMLLALAWLVRIEDTPKHRLWLKTVMDDLIQNQQECGAIPEALGNPNTGHYQAPQSNEAYGTTETPLIQENGDPVSDQLYVSGFALLALREANAAIDEPRYRNAEERLAEYLVRIQVHAPTHRFLDGTWFRAFDFERWDYWSSSGDMGWGAWCAETGWGPAWNVIVFGLIEKKTSLWDVASELKLKESVQPAVPTAIE